MPVYFVRLLCGKPLLTAIIIVSPQFFLLRVHRYHRRPRRQGPLHLCVDVTELRVAVGMVRAFFRLAIALQAVVLIAQKLRHFLMADRMLLPCKLSGQIPCALASPTQGRFRVASRVRFNQTVQRLEVALDRALQYCSCQLPTGECAPAQSLHPRSPVSRWRWLFVKAHKPAGSSKLLHTPTTKLHWLPLVVGPARQAAATRRRTSGATKSRHRSSRSKHIPVHVRLLPLFIDDALAELGGKFNASHCDWKA